MNDSNINGFRRSLVVDRAAGWWTPERLHRVFLNYGCAIIRGGIPIPILEETHRTITTAYKTAEGAHVNAPDLLAASDEKISGFELVETPLISEFMALVFAGQPWGKYLGTPYSRH